MPLFNAGMIRPRHLFPDEIRFDLGNIIVTPGASTQIDDDEVNIALDRHQRGDWGVVDALEKACNERVVKLGGWLLSAYDSNDGLRFLVMTRPDRCMTTVMLPEEF